MRRLVALALAAVVAVVGAGWLSGTSPLEVVAVPPKGTARPVELKDGTPVFVVHTRAGKVHVVDARSPHRKAGVAQLVGWCEQSETFVDYDAMYAADGRVIDRFIPEVPGEWPPDVGLTTYEVTLSGERRAAAVGDPKPAAQHAPRPRRRSYCFPSPVSDDPPKGFEGRYGTVLAPSGGPALWCPHARGFPSTECGSGGQRIADGSFYGDGTGRYDGPVWVRPRPDGTVDAALLPGGTPDTIPPGGLRRVFGWVVHAFGNRWDTTLYVDEVVIFIDPYAPPVPLGFRETVPTGWRMTDLDGNRLVRLETGKGVLEETPEHLEGKLLDFVVEGKSNIVEIRPVRRRSATTE